MYKDKNEEVQTINWYLSHVDDPEKSAGSYLETYHQNIKGRKKVIKNKQIIKMQCDLICCSLKRRFTPALNNMTPALRITIGRVFQESTIRWK